MKFQDILTEKYLTSVTIKGVKGLEVFINPPQKEVTDAMKVWKSAKLLLDKKNNLYVFTPDIEHNDMAQALGLSIRDTISLFATFNSNELEVYNTNLTDIPIQNADKIYERVRKRFPIAILKKLGRVIIQTNKGSYKIEV